MSSGGGRLREVVAYETLDHNGSKFVLISVETGPCANADAMIYSCKSELEKKIRFFPLRNFRFLY